MLVNVSFLLKDVIEIPDLDAAVDGRGDDAIVGADDQGLDLNDSLERKEIRHDRWNKGDKVKT